MNARIKEHIELFKTRFKNLVYMMKLRLHIGRFHFIRFLVRKRMSLRNAIVLGGSFLICLTALGVVFDGPYLFKRALKKSFGIGGPRALKLEHYKVQPSESLWTIAKKNGLSFDSLITINKLRNIHQLQPGQEILIPNQDGIMYTVRPGEQVWSIAERFDMSVEDLLDANDLSLVRFNTIRTDFEIFVPGARLNYEDRLDVLGLSFIRPTGGRIRSAFGWRTDPLNPSQRRYHTGVDFACNVGTPIRAAADGQVIYTGRKGGYGIVVILRHSSGYTTIYAHLSRATVGNGEFVKAGQVIARSGNTGRTTGPHLHFEVRRYGVPVNPLGTLHVFSGK